MTPPPRSFLDEIDRRVLVCDGAMGTMLYAKGIFLNLRTINVQGVRVARHAARDRVFVAGAIGPLGIRIEPWGKTGVDEAEEYFYEQATALAEGGVDLFILETFRDLNELGAAIRAVKRASTLPVVAQMTTEEDGNSLDGTPPEVSASGRRPCSKPSSAWGVSPTRASRRSPTPGSLATWKAATSICARPNTWRPTRVDSF
jgi:methionine synthase I (cobalamin-dependent)